MQRGETDPAATLASARLKRRTSTIYSGNSLVHGRTSEPTVIKQIDLDSYGAGKEAIGVNPVEKLESENSSEMPIQDMMAFKKFIITTGDHNVSPQVSNRGSNAVDSAHERHSELSKRAHVPVSQRKYPSTYVE